MYEGWWQQLNVYEKEKSEGISEFSIIVWIFRRVRSHGTAIRQQMERKILLIRANFILEFQSFVGRWVLIDFRVNDASCQPTNMNISTWIEDLINVNPQIQSEVNFFKHFCNLGRFFDVEGYDSIKYDLVPSLTGFWPILENIW
jgi:hypothetical protein